jgi:hypothetical protein
VEEETVDEVEEAELEGVIRETPRRLKPVQAALLQEDRGVANNQAEGAQDLGEAQEVGEEGGRVPHHPYKLLRRDQQM